nr:hypothetical protein [Pandoravirus massiliensis]
MDALRQTPRLSGHTRPIASAADSVSASLPSTPRTSLGITEPNGPAPRTALPQPQHPMAAVRVEMASLASSINAAIVGMQASIDNLAVRCARIEKRLNEEARRAAEGQRVVADHVESLWRAIDGSREAINWCWARVTPATEGRAWLRARLVGHRQPQQPQQHHHQERGEHQYAHNPSSSCPSSSSSFADKNNSAINDNNGIIRSGGSGVEPDNGSERDSALVLDVGDGGWLCVRYPMVRAADDGGAKCVWMRTTLVDEANGDMCHYWVKAYDLDAQMAFLSEYTNVPPCFDTEPLSHDDDDDEDDDGEEKDHRDGDTEGESASGEGRSAERREGDRHSGGDRGGSARQRYHDARDGPTAPAPVILREGPHLNAIGRRGGERSGDSDGHRNRAGDHSRCGDDDDDFSSDGGPL